MIPKPSKKKIESLEEIESRKVSLLSEITELGMILEELDKKVSNHEAKNKEYVDISESIEKKSKELSGVESKLVHVEPMKIQINDLETSICDKSKDLSDLVQKVDSEMRKVKILQKEISDFEQFSIKQKDDHKVFIQNMNSEIELLYSAKEKAISHVESVINSLK